MDYRGAGNLAVTGCVVFLTQLGTAVREWVSGTFQANVADSAGNIKTITDGSFHRPLSAPP